MKKAFAYTLIVCVSLFTFGCSSSTTKAPTEKKTTPTTTSAPAPAAPAVPAADATKK